MLVCAGWCSVCHFVLISSCAIQPETTPWRPCLTQHPGCNYTHTHAHTLPNLSKFILCQTDTRTSTGVCFQRRCDLNCLSLKLTLIALTVLLYGNRGLGRGWRGWGGKGKVGEQETGQWKSMLSTPAESTHTHTHTDSDCRLCHLSLLMLSCIQMLKSARESDHMNIT